MAGTGYTPPVGAPAPFGVRPPPILQPGCCTGHKANVVPTAYITHPSFLLHDMGPFHPECPDRLRAIGDRLIGSGLDSYLVHYSAPAADNDAIARVHGRSYIATIEAESPESGLHYLDPDTAMNAHSLTAARHAAGAIILATDLVVRGECRTAFCAVRPPGHHAERDRAMGFCLFNNVAVGAAHALEAHGIERVAIVDFDVHHGNGTENIFSRDPRVLMVSTFQYPLYPYSGLDNPAAEHGEHPACGGRRQRGVSRRRARALASGARAASPAAHLRVRRIRRPPRGPAGRAQARRCGLRMGHARARSRSPRSTRRGASFRRWRAATRSGRSAEAPRSTYASSSPPERTSA